MEACLLICGGFRASERFNQSKEDQIAKELERLSNLKQGSSYPWPLSTGIERFTFDGHCRKENLDSVWAGKISRHVKILATQFAERDTVGGTRKLISFDVPQGQAIHGVVTNQGELRIVTQPSADQVKNVHHRMPSFLPIEGDETIMQPRVQYKSSLYDR